MTKVMPILAIILTVTFSLSCSNKLKGSKEDNTEFSIEDKRWEIIELFGQPVEGTKDTHYLIFHSDKNSLEAKANCNILLKKYTISNQFQLKIEMGISTMKACPDDLEDQLTRALTMADNYTTDKTSLSINKARMAPLVRLRLVE